MDKRAGAGLAVVAVAVAATIALSDRPVDRPDASVPPAQMAAQAFRLENGLEVELVTGPCGERSAIVLLFEIGADHDPAGRSGMAHVIERMIAADAEGGDREVPAGTDHIAQSVRVDGDAVLSELDAIATRIAAPPITDDALARARHDVLAGVAARHGGDAALTASSFAVESVRPSRGEGFRGGVLAEVEAITPDELAAFWRAHLAPVNARLVVMGAFDPAATRARIEAAFAGLPPGSEAPLREPGNSSVTGTLVMGDAPAALAIAAGAPAFSDPLYPAFLVLAARLAAGHGAELTWEATYDAIARPEAWLATAALTPGVPGEVAAERLRGETTALVARPLSAEDVCPCR